MSEAKSSRVSISARSFVNANGAGSSTKATATSPTGETSISSAEEFVVGATSSRGSAIASAKSDSAPTAIATAECTGTN